MIKNCNLHTVISLPQGVFLPYSNNKTSVIFFDKTTQTKDIWFYEVSLIEGKRLTKKNGISDKHFEDLIKLYKSRQKTPKSWLISVDKILESRTNLSAAHYNPHAIENEELLEPNEYATEIKNLLKNSSKNIDELLKELN